MFHSVYPAPLVIGNNAPYKFPYFVTYNDLPVLTIEPITAFAPYTCVSPIYISPVAYDVSSNMRRVPVNWLMQNIETVNCRLPAWRKKDYKWTMPERPFSKESSVDLNHGSDSCMASSRSSTPSSVEVSAGEEDRSVTGSYRSPSPFKRQRKYSNSHAGSYARSTHQKYYSVNQRNLPDIKRTEPVQSKNNHMDSLSLEIWRHYVRNRQPEEMYFKKMNLRDEMHRVLREIYRGCELCVVGSSVNGLGTKTSDMDVCLILTLDEVDQQTTAMQILRNAQKLLNTFMGVQNPELITAKVPILKFMDKNDEIQVDLNINNTVGIANTHLIRCYCCMDWRFQPLMLAIKKWAQDCDINNAKDMTLSSYSLVLMVIHYLQCGCQPSVLPCLQRMKPKIFQDNYARFGSTALPNYKSKNDNSLGELFIGFFDYYANRFNFREDVISVRLGCVVSKHTAMNFRSAKNKRGHWKYICIEEPFNRTNTACAVYDAQSFGRILDAFRSTWIKLQNNRHISAALKL